MAAKKRIRAFKPLERALLDILAYERGEPVNVRVTVLPDAPRKLSPKEIRAVRKKLNASQALFAHLLNVSANTVESWEQGVRKPQAAALKLLHIARTHPEVLLKVG